MRIPAISIGVPELDQISERARHFFLNYYDGVIEANVADQGVKNCQLELIKFKMGMKAKASRSPIRKGAPARSLRAVS